MNPVQAAIARVAGLDETIQTFEAERLDMANVLESIVATNQMMERQLEDLDYLNLFDPNGISEVLPGGPERKKTLTRLRRMRHDNPIAKQAVKLMVRFTLGRGIQWVITSDQVDPGAQPPPTQLPVDQQPSRGLVPIKFTDSSPKASNGAGGNPFAKSPSQAAKEASQVVSDQQDNDPIRNIWMEFVSDTENKLAFTTHKSLQVMLDQVITDGEKFYICFESPGVTPYLKVTEIPVEEIEEIIYDPNNRLRPVYYRRQFIEKKYNGANQQYEPDGAPKSLFYLDYRITDDDLTKIKGIKIPKAKIGEGKVRHILINDLQTKTGIRGVSELYASREWFRVFKEFMEGRAAINQAAQAISYVRKIKGGPAAVASMSGRIGGLPTGESLDNTEVQKLTRPVKAAVYNENQAVELDWMKTDTGAQNAKEDARMLLATGGAGVSTMVHYFGEGGDANLATAQSMELPMVKSYEDWQQFVEDFFIGWFEYVLRLANESEDPKSISEDVQRFGITFPPIITQDVVKFTTAWAQVVRDIAPNNMVIRKESIRAILGILQVANIDALMPAVEAEMEQAELQRQADKQAMLDSLNNPANPMNPANPNDPNADGTAPTKIPNADGQGPNFKRLAAGKGEKVSNGPKSA